MKGFNCQKCFHITSCITALLHFEIAAECVSISLLTLRLDLSGHVSVRLPDHPAALQGLIDVHGEYELPGLFLYPAASVSFSS